MLDGYSVSSQRLYAIYASLPGYPPPTAVLEDGVDLDLFAPRRPGRSPGSRDHGLVIGWVGNSAWNEAIEDFKGVHTILRPALRLLQERGIDVRESFADRQERFIPHDQMPAYYARIDVLVCTSSVEGTPNPVLEAMASGVPVVTTDVGIVPQAFGPLQQRFILSERTIPALVDRLAELARHRSLLRELSRENLDQVREWGWDRKALGFRDFFDLVLGG
jgi:glycosyltransferase involved in cell wall biosynthesis